MMPIVQCTHCAAKLHVSEEVIGRKMVCPVCRFRFKAECAPSKPAIMDEPLELDDSPAREKGSDRWWEDQDKLSTDAKDRGSARRRPHTDEDEAPASRHRRRDTSNEDDDDDLNWRAERKRRDGGRTSRRGGKQTGSRLPLVAILGAVGIAFGIGVVFLLVRGGKITESSWKTFEAPNRCKVEMPGSPKKKSESIASGLDLVMHLLELNSKCAFIVGYTEGEIPIHRRMLPPEVLLNESCDGMKKGVGAQWVEQRRESFTYLGFPAKQMIFDVPQLKTKAVVRFLFSGERIFYLCVAGQDYSPDHGDVRRFFDSFEILGVQAQNVNAPGRNPQEPEAPVKPPREDQNSQPPPRTRPEYELRDIAVLASRPADPKLAAGGMVYLSDLQEFGWKAGPSGWSFGKNGKLETIWAPNAKILVDGKTFAHGLSMIPPDNGFTRICYALGKKGAKLEGAVALSEDEAGNKPPPTRFVVLGDGKLLWRSGSLSAHRVREEFSVDVAGVGILELRVYVENGWCFGSHGAWLDPTVTVKK